MFLFLDSRTGTARPRHCGLTLLHDEGACATEIAPRFSFDVGWKRTAASGCFPLSGECPDDPGASLLTFRDDGFSAMCCVELLQERRRHISRRLKLAMPTCRNWHE